MPLPSPNRPTGPTNELAKERSRAAAERTLVAWMQHCLILLGFGIALDQLSQALAPGAVQNLGLDLRLTPMLALGFVAFSMVLLGIALVQYRLEVRAIERDDYVLSSIGDVNRIAVIAIVLFGLISSLVIFVSMQR